jgi:hypothetical protein
MSDGILFVFRDYMGILDFLLFLVYVSKNEYFRGRCVKRCY